MEVKGDFLRFGTFIIKDGAQIRFWEDKWLGNTSLRKQFPNLFYIVRHKQATVAEVLQTFPLAVQWRTGLVGPELVAWVSGRSVSSESLRVLSLHLLLNPRADLSRRRGDITNCCIFILFASDNREQVRQLTKNEGGCRKNSS